MFCCAWNEEVKTKNVAGGMTRGEYIICIAAFGAALIS